MKLYSKFLLIILIVPIKVDAQTVIDITQGSEDPYRLAIIAKEGNQKQTQKVLSIVSQDLKRTGEFYIFDNKLLLSLPQTEEDIEYREWRLLNCDFILIADIQETVAGIQLSYEIFDVANKEKIRSSKVYGITDRFRQLGHYASDGVYETITGIPGIASTRIMYVTQTSDSKSKYQLFIADADGLNEQLLLRSSKPIISPVWSPDSSRVAYVSFETGVANVFIQEIATGKRFSVINKKCNDCRFNEQISSPAWSPDGKYLSLTLYQDGNAEIYIFNINKKLLTRMTNHYGIDTESKWSNNGRKLLFTSGRSGSPQLYEIDLRKLNKRPKRLTFEGNYNAKGSYLPDDSGIVFVHRATNKFQIAIKYFDDNFVIPLTESKMDESPSVAPNGNVIIYAITENNQDILAGVTLGGVKFRLPSASGQVREPAWSGFLN